MNSNPTVTTPTATASGSATVTASSPVSGLSLMTPRACTIALLSSIISLDFASMGDAGPIFTKLACKTNLDQDSITRLNGIISYVWGQINPNQSITSDDLTQIFDALQTTTQSL